jgi:nucleoside recognition membrane protein YjiH
MGDLIARLRARTIALGLAELFLGVFILAMAVKDNKNSLFAGVTTFVALMVLWAFTSCLQADLDGKPHDNPRKD